jgi:hypothetical protein
MFRLKAPGLAAAKAATRAVDRLRAGTVIAPVPGGSS